MEVVIQILATAGAFILIREVVAPTLFRITGWAIWATVSTCWICAGFHAGWLAWLVATFAPEAVTWALVGVAVSSVTARVIK